MENFGWSPELVEPFAFHAVRDEALSSSISLISHLQQVSSLCLIWRVTRRVLFSLCTSVVPIVRASYCRSTEKLEADMLATALRLSLEECTAGTAATAEDGASRVASHPHSPRPTDQQARLFAQGAQLEVIEPYLRLGNIAQVSIQPAWFQIMRSVSRAAQTGCVVFRRHTCHMCDCKRRAQHDFPP